MKGLDPSQISKLLTTSQSTRAKKTKVIQRTYMGWFDLRKKAEPRGSVSCANPECTDTRDNKNRMIVIVDGFAMCRRCFLAGWKEKPPQEQLTL